MIDSYTQDIPSKQVDVTSMPPISVSGSDGAVLDGVSPTIKATVLDLATTNPQAVAIVDGTGAQITSFGGGTQYTEGDVDASLTGTAMLMEGAGNTVVPVQGTAADGVLVNLGGNNDVTVTGTVTATATDLDIRNLSKAQDEVYSVLRTDAGTAYDARQVTVQNATLAVTQSGTWDEVGINDSGNSITVDAPVATPVFVRLSDGAAAITTLPVSLASVPSHAVTNAGTFAVQQSTYSTSSVTSVAGSATSVQLLASTAGRRGAYFYNDSSAIAYLKLGTTASTSSFTVAMAANSFYELPYPCYTGRIDCIWASAAGNMRITEIT